jgi:putative membrane protein
LSTESTPSAKLATERPVLVDLPPYADGVTLVGRMSGHCDTVAMAVPESPPKASPRYPLMLLAAFALWWLLLAIRPSYRQDWLLENMLVFAAVPLLAWSYPRLRLSNGAYTCLFAFFVLHAVGAHYTYAEVPYDRWAQAVTGRTVSDALGLGRNHYDRLVHFAYGLLVAPAAIEVLDARAPQRGLWRWLVPLLFMISHSTIYEMIEWAAAALFGGELGQAYLGTQGDVWDAQKDSALAGLGALISVVICRFPRIRRDGNAVEN